MKELKPKIIDIQAKRRLKAIRQASLHNHSLTAVTEPIQSINTAIAPIQPQLAQAQPLSKQGRQQLAAQAERVNLLSAELEEAVFELKAIASDINCEQHIQQHTQKPLPRVCEYLAVVVPCVKQKKSGTFVLTTRSVDLFRAEREAAQVAQVLRRQTKRKQIVSPLSRRNKLSVLKWLTAQF